MRKIRAVLSYPLIALAFAACTTQANYWTYTSEHYEVTSVYHVADPAPYCALSGHLDGCINKNPHTLTAEIYIRSGMPQWLDACTEAHERKHAAGGTHRQGVPSDCYL